MTKIILVLLVFLTVSNASSFASEKSIVTASDFASVKPILMSKCAICHASEVKRPFSSKIPIWNHASGTNIKLARKKYDMDALLAGGEVADVASLQLLEHVVGNQSMPPAQYKMMRPGKKISDQERDSILNWIYTKHPDWKV